MIPPKSLGVFVMSSEFNMFFLVLGKIESRKVEILCDSNLLTKKVARFDRKHLSEEIVFCIKIKYKFIKFSPNFVGILK